MNSESQSYQWLALPLMLLFSGGMEGAARSAEYLPLEGGRVESEERRSANADRIDGTEAMEAAGLRGPRREFRSPTAESEGWSFGVAVAAAYDDNIFLSAIGAQDDLVLRVTPRIAYVIGHDSEGEGARLRVEYRPSLVAYAEHSEARRADHNLALEAEWRGKRSAVIYRGRYLRLGDATADTGTQTDRSDYASELRVAWDARSKMVIEAAVGVSGVDYDARGLSDSRDLYGEVALRYAYSPKTQLGFAYRAGRIAVDRSADQTYQRAVARVAWRPREKFGIELEAGGEYRDYGSDSDVVPVFLARAEWLPREGTTLFVSGYRREDVSGFSLGQNIEVSGVVAGVSQRIGDKWVATLEGGAEWADYKQVSGPGVAVRDDQAWFLRPRLDYRANDHLRVGVFYQWSENDSSGSGLGYENQQAGVEVDYEF